MSLAKEAVAYAKKHKRSLVEIKIVGRYCEPKTGTIEYSGDLSPEERHELIHMIARMFKRADWEQGGKP